MTASLIILGVVDVFLVWRLEAHKRDSLDRLAAQAEKWLAERERTATAHRDQLQTLLNQIKPDTAQPVIPTDAVSPPAVNPFSDDDFHESREELADRLMREEVVSRGR